MQHWQEPQETETDHEEIVTLQKLQAMMGDDAEPDLDELTTETMEKVLLGEVTPSESADEPRCSECGTSWKSIHEDGLVGCPHCYVTFAASLEKVMAQLHRSVEHTGKMPRFREKQERLKEHQEKREQHRVEMLQHRLDAAIQAENFEEAAQIRDKIAQVSK
jgi:protein arginine kinase activator